MKDFPRFRVMVVKKSGGPVEQWSSLTYLKAWLHLYQDMLRELRQIYVEVWTEDEDTAFGSGRPQSAAEGSAVNEIVKGETA